MTLSGYIDISDKYLAPVVPIVGHGGKLYGVVETGAGHANLFEGDFENDVQPFAAPAAYWRETFEWENDVIYRVGRQIVCCRRNYRSLLIHGVLIVHRHTGTFSGWKSSLAIVIPEATAAIEAILSDHENIFDPTDPNRAVFLRRQFALARPLATHFSLSNAEDLRGPEEKIPSYARLRSTDFSGRFGGEVLWKCIFAVLYTAGFDRFLTSDVVYECWRRYPNITEETIYKVLRQLLKTERNRREGLQPGSYFDRLAAPDGGVRLRSQRLRPTYRPAEAKTSGSLSKSITQVRALR